MHYKFRGYDKDIKSWVYGYYVYHEDTMHCCVPLEENERHHYIIFDQTTDWDLPNNWLRSEVDETSVGMFTGIKDMNGNEIYEDDILFIGGHCENGTVIRRGTYWAVEFNNGAFEPLDFHDCDFYKVVGNVYEKLNTEVERDIDEF